MSVTIDLPPAIEASLAAQAAARGVSLAEHLRRLLVAQASGSGARETPEKPVKLWRDVSGFPDTKPLSDEAISRESIYSEREENGALGRDWLKKPWRSADHAELLYNARGLPR